MKRVEPAVYLIASSQLREAEARRWLDDLGAHEYKLPTTQEATPGEAVTSLAARRCYMSYQPGLNPNVTRVRKDMSEFIDNILASGHGSVLEHVSFTFALENVSRVFTAEMNRHRAGMAISEGSMRFIRFTDIPFWTPFSLQHDDDSSPEILNKKAASREIFDRVFKYAEDSYSELLKIWESELSPQSKFADKKSITSMMRRIIPMGVASGGVWTGNIRALRHVFGMRCGPAAEEEILYVASLMLKCMAKTEPILFGDFALDSEGFWRPKYPKV